MNFRGLFNAKAILEVKLWYYLIYSQGDKGVQIFPKGINQKVNGIVQLEFELAYYDIVVQHVSHYTYDFLTNQMYLGQQTTSKLEKQLPELN